MSVAMGIRGRARRRALGLSTGELARRLGYSRGRLYNLECYGAGSLRVIERWAAAIEMDPAELAFGTAPKASLAQAIARVTTRIRSVR